MQTKKVQTLNCVIATSTAAARTEFRLTTDSEFPVCEGFYAIVNTAGGLTRYNIGIKTDEKTIQDLANKQHSEASTSVKIADRFYRETPFKAGGKVVVVTIETFATTSSELNIDVLFELSKKPC